MPASRTFSVAKFPVVWRHQPLLREGVADEDSRQLRDSLGALSNAIEEAVRIRRTSTDTQLIHRTATALFQGVREHQRLLTGAGFRVAHPVRVWGVPAGALWELGQSVSTWKEALELRHSSETEHFDKFELLAWRTLGEGLAAHRHV